MPLSLSELMQRASQLARRQRPSRDAAAAEQPAFAQSDLGAIGPLVGSLGEDTQSPPPPAAEPREAASAGSAPSVSAAAHFEALTLNHADAEHHYRLFEPARRRGDAERRPLLVLLHGCTQDAADFASGTAMNEFAAQHDCLVAYPEQSKNANSGRCWNWFLPEHQQRDQGEPGMIAALTRQVLQSTDADPQRVYIAGLSAGGAMAITVAQLYPELFAAVGVHSGLARGLARDMASAFTAMRRGPAAVAPAEAPAIALPTIVFHGESDRTVHPDNAELIVQHGLDALTQQGLELQLDTRLHAASARPALRSRYVDNAGRSWLEHWKIESGPHAWSGGSTKGSFTDPNGPSASAAMLEFFLQHRR